MRLKTGSEITGMWTSDLLLVRGIEQAVLDYAFIKSDQNVTRGNMFSLVAITAFRIEKPCDNSNYGTQRQGLSVFRKIR